MPMVIIVDLPGVASFESGTTENDARGRGLLDVCKAFGDVIYATLPRVASKDAVLVTDDRERSEYWQGIGGTSILVEKIDEDTSDNVLVDLINLKRELIEAKDLVS